MRIIAALILFLFLQATPALAAFQTLLDAARMGDGALVEQLLSAGEDPNPPEYHNGYSPLQFAAGNGDAEMTRLILAAGANTEYRDHNGDRALLWAAQNGHGVTVGLLLDAGSPADADLDPYGITPLMKAARYAYRDVVARLLEAGADPARHEQTGDTALHIAALTDDALVIQGLLDAGADPNAREEIFNETPLHVAAVWSEPAAIEALITGGADLGLRARDGETPLFLAAKTGLGSNVAAMLAAGADPDARNAAGGTPILAAITSFSEQPGRRRAVLELAERTADIDRAFVAALGDGFGAAAFRLLERGASVNALDEDGRSALASAVRQPGLTFFQLLILRGADVERFGPQALLAAAEFGRDDIARALLARSVPVDSPNARGATPLLLAVMNAHLETVRLLLAAGADTGPVDDFGLAAGDYMAIMPSFFEGMIAHRQASRAYRPTEAIEALLEAMRSRHESIRKLLAAE